MNNLEIGKNRKNLTYHEVYLEWMEQHKRTVKESSYIRIKRYFKNYILQDLGEELICEIKAKKIQEIIDSYAKRSRSFKTIKMYMSKVFNYAILHELIDKNPCDYVVLPRISEVPQEPVKEYVFWQKKDLISFIVTAEKNMNIKWYSFFRVICFTGLRKCEALALTWDDIDFVNDRIRVNKTLFLGENNEIKIDRPKTKNSNRSVDIDKKTLEILTKYKNSKTDSNNFVFTSEKEQFVSPTYPLKILKHFVKKNNLKFTTIHNLRHMHCSILFEAGASMKEVQLRMGHADIKTTFNIYTHINSEKKTGLIDLYSKCLDNI